MRLAQGACLVFAVIYGGSAAAEEPLRATLHKMPHCECCEGHAAHLRENGFTVEIKTVEDLAPLRRAEGVPVELEGCHTILVGDFLVEGHVSAPTIKRLLSERPAGVQGIAMPGMPTGVPGMSGVKQGPINIYSFGEGEPEVFAIE